MNNRFSIIIVTWNALHHLKTFLPEVVHHTPREMEIIVADNASEDGSANWIQNTYPDVKVVRFNKNFGFAGGNNRAAQYAKNDLLLFLNNDAKPAEGWLKPLQIQFQNKNADIVQPKLKSFSNPGYFDYAGASGGYIDWLGYPFCRGRIFDTIEEDRDQYNQSVPIFWASGAAMAVRKKLFQTLGGFDEDFMFHMEEIDFCWRAHKAGAKVVAEPKSVVYHLGGGSLPETSPQKTFLNYRNSLLMLLKNLDRFLVSKLFFRLLLDGVAGIRLFLTGKPMHALAIIRSHFSFYRQIPATLDKRKIVQKNKSKSLPGLLIHKRLIIVDYFVKKHRTFSKVRFSE